MKIIKNYTIFFEILPIDTIRAASRDWSFFHIVFQQRVENCVEFRLWSVEKLWKMKFWVFLRCGKSVEKVFLPPFFHIFVRKRKTFAGAKVFLWITYFPSKSLPFLPVSSWIYEAILMWFLCWYQLEYAPHIWVSVSDKPCQNPQKKHSAPKIKQIGTAYYE